MHPTRQTLRTRLAHMGGTGTDAGPTGWTAGVRRPRLWSLGCTILSMVAIPSLASGATIDVATTQALEAAIASGTPGDVIVLASGDYAPEATLQIRRDLTVRGPYSAPGARVIGSGIASDTLTDTFAVDAGVTATLTNLTLSQGAPSGAALNVSGTATLSQSTVSGNAGFGIVTQGGARLELVNSTVTDNLDAGIVAQPGSSVLATNATIASNHLGIYNEVGSDVRLRSTILANPSGDCLSPFQGSIASIERAVGGCGANIRADDVLGRPAANGGPTPTRTPASQSPARDAGDAASCPVADQRYAARVGPCDIGAVELDGVPGSAVALLIEAQSLPPCARILTRAPRSSLNVVARGALGRKGPKRAVFAVTVRPGATPKSGIYRDPRKRVAIRLTVMTAVRASRGVVIARGVSRDINGRHRARCFTIRMRDGHPDGFAIRLSTGYSRSGSLTAGRVVISGRATPVLHNRLGT